MRTVETDAPLKHTNYLQMNLRLMFDSCFKYETLIRFDFGQRMTHGDRRIIQARIENNKKKHQLELQL